MNKGKVIDYKILEANSPKNLEKEINQLRLQGYEVKGGVSLYKSVFCMVIMEKREKQ